MPVVNVLKGTMCNGERLEEGESVEIADHDAVILTALGKVEIQAKKEKKAKNVDE